MGLSLTDRNALDWRIATRSGGANCVEVAAAGDMIAVRNSRRPDAELILFTADEFEAFLHDAKQGEFDEMLARPHPPR